MTSEINKETIQSPALSDRFSTSSEELKKQTRTTTVEVGSAKEEVEAFDRDATWTPGFWEQFPWIGFAGFLTVLLGMGLSIAVLMLSDGKLARQWPSKRLATAPNVLVNIANQIGNLGLITFIGQGLAIAWWRKALRGGTIETLHRNHSFSTSFLAVLTSGKHFNFIALAALAMKFAVIDSTLFQKATRTQISYKSLYDNATAHAWVESIWPAHTGASPGDDMVATTLDESWALVVDNYKLRIANGKLHDNSNQSFISFTDCPYNQECQGSLPGYGFKFVCNTTVEDIDYGSQNHTKGDELYLFNSSFSTNWATNNEGATITLDMFYVDSYDANDGSFACPGTITYRTCQIIPATVQYPLTIMTPAKQQLERGNIVTHISFSNQTAWDYPYGVDMSNDTQIDELNVLSTTDLIEEPNNTSTVATMTFIFNQLFASSAYLTYESEEEYHLMLTGSQTVTNFLSHGSNQSCGYQVDYTDSGYAEPLIDLLRSINTFAFVSSVWLSKAPQHVLAERETTAPHLQKLEFETAVSGIVEIYQTNLGYMVGALCAILFTVICVLPVYWGFWDLGRKVTLGPMEIARAFNAPILDTHNSKGDGNIDELLGVVGDRKVQYGKLVHAQGQMGIAEPHKVTRPVSVLQQRNSGHVGAKVGIGAALGAVVAAGIGSPTK